MGKREITAGKNDAGLRLDKFLLKKYNDLPVSLMYAVPFSVTSASADSTFVYVPITAAALPSRKNFIVFFSAVVDAWNMTIGTDSLSSLFLRIVSIVRNAFCRFCLGKSELPLSDMNQSFLPFIVTE